MTPLNKTTNSPAETILFAYTLAKKLKGGDILLLKGGLGSGKTTFTKGLARYFGIRSVIQSPTFVIYKPYQIIKHQKTSKAKHLVHIDAYRLAAVSELADLGLNELFTDPQNILVIENPKKLFLGFRPSYLINFINLELSKRKIIVKVI